MRPTITLTLVMLSGLSLFAQAPNAIPPAPIAPAQTAPDPIHAAPPPSVHIDIQKRIPIIYSHSAEEKKLQGTVVLSVLFNETGAAENPEIVSGDPALAHCALDSLGKWGADPLQRDGKPVKVKIPLTFEFVYDDPPVSFSDGEMPVQTGGADVDRVTLSAHLAGRRVLRQIPPHYPAMGTNLRVRGTVDLAAAIGKDGTIRQLDVVKGNPLLATAALEAVRQWRYKPYIYHGRPVAFDTRIEVDFQPAP